MILICFREDRVDAGKRCEKPPKWISQPMEKIGEEVVVKSPARKKVIHPQVASETARAPEENAKERHKKLDALERIVFEDFNSSLYASKSTVVMDGFESYLNFGKVKQKLKFIDPRGYINICWLSLQV